MIEVCLWENNSTLADCWLIGNQDQGCHFLLLFLLRDKRKLNLNVKLSFPGDSDSKEYACNVGDPGSIPASGRSPGEGNGNPLQ